MNSPRVSLVLFGLCSLAALPVPEKIESLDQLSSAAADVRVAVIEFTIPTKKEAAELALEKRFFNQPFETRFSGVTSSVWETKWDLLASTLVEKARSLKLDANSLQACLKTLNRGRTEETMDVAYSPRKGYLSDTPPAEVAKGKKEDQSLYEAAMKDRKEHPEQWQTSNVAVPVAAFLAKHSNGSCWVIVCKWTMTNSGLAMDHVRVWAMDTVTHKTVAYVTCD